MLYTQNQGLAKSKAKSDLSISFKRVKDKRKQPGMGIRYNLYKNEKGMALSYSDNGLV